MDRNQLQHSSVENEKGDTRKRRLGDTVVDVQLPIHASNVHKDVEC